jgi:signal transduction histidine kinase
MNFNVTALSFCGMVGCLIILVLMVIVWMRRPAPGIFPMVLLMLSTAVWVAGNVFEGSSTSVASTIWFNKVSYLGISSTGVFWLIFTLDYTGSDWWRKTWRLVLISLIPVVGLLIAWTNELHGWQWTDVYMTQGSAGTVFVWDRGWAAWLNIAYQYVLSFTGIVILLRFVSKRSAAYKKQVALMITGLFLPMAGTILYSLRLPFTGGIDFTSICLVIASVFYSIAVLKFRFPDIVPVAYRTIIQTIPDGFLVLDDRDNVLDVNPVAAGLIGQEKRSLLGKSLSAIWPALSPIVSGDADVLHTELTAGDAAKPVFLDIGIATLHDSRHHDVGKLVLLRDITELRTIQHELKSLYEKEHDLRGSLEKEINNRNQYTRALVHELGTPLTAIVASAELLEDLSKDPVQRNLVKNIMRSSSNLEQRVNELLDLARGELGKLKIEPELLDLKELVQEVVSEMTPLAGEKGVALTSEFSVAELPAMVDKKRIRQVIINLLSNALKFTYTGKITVRDVNDEPGWIKIQVQDTGIGMNREHLDNLFNPYFRQIKDEANNSGLGIGLSLSRIFIELHKGKLWAESEPGKGTVFSFTIPVDKR